MKIIIDTDNGHPFIDLVNGNYSWATLAKLTFSGIGSDPPAVDVSWLLSATISISDAAQDVSDQQSTIRSDGK